jgi:predicted nucleotidyltransferase
MPINTYKIFNELVDKNYKFVYGDYIFPYLKYKLLTEGEKIKDILDVKEGLENKILKEIILSNSLNELILNVKSKRYTYTRINRILTSFFIGLENYNNKEIITEKTNYIRPLAFNKTGIRILREIKDKGQINILTKIPKDISDNKLKLDLLGTKAYSILNPSISPLEDYYKSPIYLK